MSRISISEVILLKRTHKTIFGNCKKESMFKNALQPAKIVVFEAPGGCLFSLFFLCLLYISIFV